MVSICILRNTMDVILIDFALIAVIQERKHPKNLGMNSCQI